MDICTAFNASVVLTLDNTDVSFPRLSPPEIAIECSRIKAAKVSQARRLATEFGVSGLDALKLVREAEDGEPTVNALWAEVCAPQAALDLLSKTLKKSGKTEAEAKDILAKLDMDKAVETALVVSGYKLEEPEDDKPAKKKKQKIEEPTGFQK